MTPDTEMVPLASLRPHPRNYRSHPPDQIEHLRESLREFGFYRNVVVADDGTILAGHGVVEAATGEYDEVPVRRMPFGPDDPRAVKILAADNEITHLAMNDDRALSELLREIAETSDTGLLGTGYDEAMLANLVFMTRDATEIRTIDQAAEWAGAGMPEYEASLNIWRLVISFDTEEERDAFAARNEVGLRRADGRVLACVWPAEPREDAASVRLAEPKREDPAA